MGFFSHKRLPLHFSTRVQMPFVSPRFQLRVPRLSSCFGNTNRIVVEKSFVSYTMSCTCTRQGESEGKRVDPVQQQSGHWSLAPIYVNLIVMFSSLSSIFGSVLDSAVLFSVCSCVYLVGVTHLRLCWDASNDGCLGVGWQNSYRSTRADGMLLVMCSR